MLIAMHSLWIILYKVSIARHLIMEIAMVAMFIIYIIKHGRDKEIKDMMVE